MRDRREEPVLLRRRGYQVFHQLVDRLFGTVQRCLISTFHESAVAGGDSSGLSASAEKLRNTYLTGKFECPKSARNRTRTGTESDATNEGAVCKIVAQSCCASVAIVGRTLLGSRTWPRRKRETSASCIGPASPRMSSNFLNVGRTATNRRRGPRGLIPWRPLMKRRIW